MRALVLLPLAALQPALVGLLDLPVDVVVQALMGVHLSMAGSWEQTKNTEKEGCQSSLITNIKQLRYEPEDEPMM